MLATHTAWRDQSVAPGNRAYVVAMAHQQSIPLMSHDDESLDHVEESWDNGCAASEFPVTLAAVRRSVAALATVPGVITPFPGGAVRSGSKVGSKYAALRASTNEAFCPALIGRIATELHADATCCIEVVIDGEDEAAVARAMAAGIRAAAGQGIPEIAAGHYGGKLGKFHFRLHDVLSSE